MGKNILIISASQREGSNSEALADAFAEGAVLAAKADNAGAAALLADAEHKKRAAAPQKKRYDFDF